MALYAYKCKTEDCDMRFDCEAPIKEGPPTEPRCPSCKQHNTVRDFNSELRTQRSHVPLHMSARNTSSRSDFLPDKKFFESPSDPEGDRGMREWKEKFKPAGSRWV